MYRTFLVADLQKSMRMRDIRVVSNYQKKDMIDLLCENDDALKDLQKTLDRLNEMSIHRREREGMAATHGSRKGYERASLFPSIPFERILPDVLHTFLRVFDVLMRNLVEDCCRSGTGRPALARLQAHINIKCKVPTFGITIGDPEGIDKDSTKVTWTDMDGGQRMRILKNIKLGEILTDKSGAPEKHRQGLWDTFGSIVTDLKSWGWAEGNNADLFEAKCKSFLTLFLASPHGDESTVGGVLHVTTRRGGYFPEDVTPYMHCLVYHIPGFMRTHGGNVMQFSCYALENLNHVRNNYKQSTTHASVRPFFSHLPSLSTRAFVFYLLVIFITCFIIIQSPSRLHPSDTSTLVLLIDIPWRRSRPS
jgi:hypothetical protein